MAIDVNIFAPRKRGQETELSPYVETRYANFTRLLPHASASLTVERRHSYLQRTSTSVKCNPVGTCNNMSVTPVYAHPLRSRNCPRNLPPKPVPTPGEAFLSAQRRVPRSDKLSRFGNCDTTSRIWARVTPSVSTVKEVTDCGNLADEGIHTWWNPPVPNKNISSASENQGMCSKNSRGTWSCPPSAKRRVLTWRAGLFSGAGNASSHLFISFEVKWMVRKRCC